MDKIDVILCMILLQNSRLSYRELAEKLNLSVNAVHKRIQAMIDNKIIRRFKTNLSLSFLEVIFLFIFGKMESNSFNIDEISNVIGNHENTYWVAIGGGNQLYIGAYLRNINEMGSFISFIKQNSKIKDLTVAIANFFPSKTPKNFKISKLDYQILNSLHYDSRKSLSNIAAELKISSKTVGRHLDQLINNDCIEFSIDWYPDLTNSIISIFHILDESIDRYKFAKELIDKFFPNVLLYWVFSNLPNLLISMTWSPTIKEFDILRKKIQDMGLESVIPYILYQGIIYETWRDNLLVEKGKI